MQATLTDKRINEFLSLFWSACDQSRSTREVASSTFWSPSAWAYLTLLRQGWAPAPSPFDEELSEYVRRLFPQGSPLDDRLPVGQFSESELKEFVLTSWWDTQSGRGTSRDAMISTRSDLADLALQLLEISDGDRVADLCCGVGTFMARAFQAYGIASFYGVDVNYDAVTLSRMRAAVLGAEIQIDLGNMFEKDGKFDRIFLDAPWGMRTSDLPLPKGRTIGVGEMIPVGINDGTSLTRADWAFVERALYCLREGGRLVVILPTGTLTGKTDEGARRNFIKYGCVESVIALPKGLVPGTMVAANLVVLTKERSEQVTFVDLSDLGEGRMPTKLADGTSAELEQRLARHDGECSASVSHRELAAEDWSLAPQRYLNRVDIDGAVPLGSLVLDVSRGSSNPKIRQRACEEQTPYRYLEIRDVDEDGNIGELTHLTTIEPREEKYCLQEGDVVLGKTRPYKVAVAHVPEGQMVLCSGNFYIIRPDQEKVDPTYLRLFFESPLARKQIDRVSVSSAVTTFNVKDLKRLQVPLVPLEDQRSIAKNYESLAAEVLIYRRRIEKARAKMADLFPEGGEA